MAKVYKIKNKVWKWPGAVAVHFVNVDKDLTEELRRDGAKHRYGFGFLAVKAIVGKTSWETALFPYKSNYLISIKAAVRKKEKIFEGDIVEIKFHFR